MPLADFALLFAAALAAAVAPVLAVSRLHRPDPYPEPPLRCRRCRRAARWSARLLEALLHLGIVAPARAGEEAPLVRAPCGRRIPSPGRCGRLSGRPRGGGRAVGGGAGVGLGLAGRRRGRCGRGRLLRASASACSRPNGPWLRASNPESSESMPASPAALDLMVLSVESGQRLDVAIAETGRELRAIFSGIGFGILAGPAGNPRWQAASRSAGRSRPPYRFSRIAQTGRRPHRQRPLRNEPCAGAAHPRPLPAHAPSPERPGGGPQARRQADLSGVLPHHAGRPRRHSRSGRSLLL